MSVEIIRSANLVPSDIDALVVLGKQSGMGSSMKKVTKSPDQLSDASRINAIAAGILWKDGRSIILSGNDRALFPNAAAKYLQDNFTDIPADSILLEGNSVDTRASAENIPSLLREKAFHNPALITVGYHVVRAANTFARLGCDFGSVIAADDIVGEYSLPLACAIGEWESLPGIKLDRAKETVLRLINPDGFVGRLGSTALGILRP